MPKFENFNDGEPKDEAQRLYGNDTSPRPGKFSAGREYKTPDDLPNDIGLYGESGESKSELAHYISGGLKEKLDKILDQINDGALLALGKECDDYLNDKGRLPASVNEAEAKELALIYQALGDADRAEAKPPVAESARRIKLVNLHGPVARAFPDDKSAVESDRKSHEVYMAKKKVV